MDLHEMPTVNEQLDRIEEPRVLGEVDELVELSPDERILYDKLKKIQNHSRYSDEDRVTEIEEWCATALIDPLRLPLERIEMIRNLVTKGE